MSQTEKPRSRTITVVCENPKFFDVYTRTLHWRSTTATMKCDCGHAVHDVKSPEGIALLAKAEALERRKAEQESRRKPKPYGDAENAFAWTAERNL